MTQRQGSVLRDAADLRSLIAVVARSPIRVAAAMPSPPVLDFADWCERQKPADIDAVVLSWLRAHKPLRTRLS